MHKNQKIKIQILSEGLANKLLGKIEDSPPSVYGEEKPTSATIPDINIKGVNREMAEILETSNKKPNYTAIVKEAIQELRKQDYPVGSDKPELTAPGPVTGPDFGASKERKKTPTILRGTGFRGREVDDPLMDEERPQDWMQAQGTKLTDIGEGGTRTTKAIIKETIQELRKQGGEGEGDSWGGGSSSWDTRKTGKGKYGITGSTSSGMPGYTPMEAEDIPTSSVFSSDRRAGSGASATEGGPTGPTGTRGMGSVSYGGEDDAPQYTPPPKKETFGTGPKKKPSIYDRPDFNMSETYSAGSLPVNIRPDTSEEGTSGPATTKYLGDLQVPEEIWGQGLDAVENWRDMIMTPGSQEEEKAIIKAVVAEFIAKAGDKGSRLPPKDRVQWGQRGPRPSDVQQHWRPRGADAGTGSSATADVSNLAATTRATPTDSNRWKDFLGSAKKGAAMLGRGAVKPSRFSTVRRPGLIPDAALKALGIELPSLKSISVEHALVKEAIFELRKDDPDSFGYDQSYGERIIDAYKIALGASGLKKLTGKSQEDAVKLFTKIGAGAAKLGSIIKDPSTATPTMKEWFYKTQKMQPGGKGKRVTDWGKVGGAFGSKVHDTKRLVGKIFNAAKPWTSKKKLITIVSAMFIPEAAGWVSSKLGMEEDEIRSMGQYMGALSDITTPGPVERTEFPDVDKAHAAFRKLGTKFVPDWLFKPPSKRGGGASPAPTPVGVPPGVMNNIQKQAPMLGGAAGQLPKTTTMTKPPNMGVGQQQPVVTGAGAMKTLEKTGKGLNKPKAVGAPKKTRSKKRKAR